MIAQLDEITDLAQHFEGKQRVQGIIANLSAEAEKVLQVTRRLNATLQRLLDARSSSSRRRVASIPRGIGVRGEGNAVNRLEQLRWLGRNRVLYWGDLDVEGFAILARLRNLFPDIKSVLMDLGTMRNHEQFVVDGSGATPPAPTNLSSAEAEAFHHCRTGNRRLEQERILQPYVERAFAALPTCT